ncbi:hypothetical protein ANO11243_050910 [Dothideomycetidae sp. 11243]|nr:hypothetical protein ANO11243_050910 [fungal sp. No.11243]
MSSASTSVTTWGISGGNASQAVVGSIVSADATATAVFLTCPGAETDAEIYDYCDNYNITMTFGPWAQITPPPSASTGVVDMQDVITFPNSFWNTSLVDQESSMEMVTGTWSAHCDVVSTTVITSCTIKTEVSVSVPNATVTSLSPESQYWGIRPQPVTITAGLEKLSSAATASPTKGSSASSAKSTVSSTGSSTSTSGSAAVSASATGAASVYAVNTGTLGLLGLVAAFLLR